MGNPDHKPYYRGYECVCADCGKFLYDVRTAGRLRALTDVDPVLLGAVERRWTSDPSLAFRLASEDVREVVSTYKLADKFNDFLMNPKARPDLQTPEAQDFLNKVKNKYLNPKTDEIMPWLTREWKKGRVRPHPSKMPGLQYQGHPDYDYPDADGNETNWHNLSEAELDHWGDWYRSDHPSRKGVDIMQLKSPEMHKTIREWDQDMRDRAESEAQSRGNIVHTYPDGWNVQQLRTPRELTDEGDAMGHCVGSYSKQVQDGNSLIYSLRDHNNQPHATWEITPRQWEIIADGKRKGEILNPDDFKSRAEQMDWAKRKLIAPRPHGGQMEQIQGKGNEPPIEPYQKRIKDYFENAMPDVEERPTWEAQHHDDPEYLVSPDDGGYVAYHPGEYGLKQPETTYDWPRLINNAIGEAGAYSETPADDLTAAAVKHGQFPQFANEAEHQINLGREQQQQEDNDAFSDYWIDGGGSDYAYDNGVVMPQDEDYYNENGDYDSDAYDKAYEQYEKEYADYERYARQEWDMGRERNPTAEYLDDLEVEIAAQRRREAQGIPEGSSQPPQVGNLTMDQITSASHRRTHPNFTTGEPCHCTFYKPPAPQPFNWQREGVFMDHGDPDICPTCGGPLEHGQCKQCDWGQWSNAMGPGDQNPTDPTKEMHPGIQS